MINIIFVFFLQKDIKSKEIEGRNLAALHQLAEMVDSVSGVGLVATKLLYEKGLEIPFLSNQNACGTMSRSRSHASIGSSSRNSECSNTLNSRDDDRILSKCLYLFLNRVLIMKIDVIFSCDDI